MHPFFSKLFSLALLSAFAIPAGAQLKIPNMSDHDSKWYYFGLTFGANYSCYKVSPTPVFAEADTFSLIQPKWGPGFNVGIMGNLRITRFIDLRFIPALVFSEKKFTLDGQLNGPEEKTVESIYMQLPFQAKFKSDRLHNFRFYGLLGAKLDYDLAANARSRRSDEWLRLRPLDIGAEVGVGFEFYFPNFIFTPELKFSHGFLNLHFPDNSIPLSNSIDRITSRMIVFSIHLQG